MKRRCRLIVFFLFVGIMGFAQSSISALRWMDDGGDFAGSEWLNWSKEEKACYVIGAELAYAEMFSSNEIARDHETTREKEFWNNFLGFKISLTKMIKAIDTFYADKANLDMQLVYAFLIVRPALQKDTNANPE